eukprot:153288-Rhodomonas_salina.1
MSSRCIPSEPDAFQKVKARANALRPGSSPRPAEPRIIIKSRRRRQYSTRPIGGAGSTAQGLSGA